MDRRLTASQLAVFRTCQRRHYFQYIEGIVPQRDSQPLRLGSAYHAGLDMLKQGDSFGAVELAVQALYNTPPAWCRDEDQLLDWNVEMVTVIELLRGWVDRWRLDTPWTVEHSEASFDLPLVNPETKRASQTFRIAGKIDGVGKVGDQYVLIEHKTTSDDIDSPDSLYWKRLAIDQQISHYVVAARALGYDISSCWYDVTRKPAIRPNQVPCLDENGFKVVLDQSGQRVWLENGKPRQSADKAKGWELVSRTETADEFQIRLREDIAANPDRYYQRREIPRIDADVEDYQDELWGLGQMIAENHRKGRHPRNTNVCVHPYRCPYFELCCQGVKKIDDVPEGFVKLNDPHPELEG